MVRPRIQPIQRPTLTQRPQAVSSLSVVASRDVFGHTGKASIRDWTILTSSTNREIRLYLEVAVVVKDGKKDEWLTTEWNE